LRAALAAFVSAIVLGPNTPLLSSAAALAASSGRGAPTVRRPTGTPARRAPAATRPPVTGSAAAPGPLPRATGADAITQTQLRGHLSFIADDLLEGRDTPSRGLDLAALYLAAQCRRLGLKPAGDNNTYYQKIDLARIAVVRNESRATLHLSDLQSSGGGPAQTFRVVRILRSAPPTTPRSWPRRLYTRVTAGSSRIGGLTPTKAWTCAARS
jgi:hypothetical protein